MYVRACFVHSLNSVYFVQSYIGVCMLCIISSNRHLLYTVDVDLRIHCSQSDHPLSTHTRTAILCSKFIIALILLSVHGHVVTTRMCLSKLAINIREIQVAINYHGRFLPFKTHRLAGAIVARGNNSEQKMIVAS